MTDEEKAEEIANERCKELMCWGRCNIHKNHHCGYWHYNYECALKGIEYGLAEGRKELEQWKQEWQDAQIKANEEGFARTTLQIKYNKLEKENAELKEQISVLLSCSNCKENKGGYICDKEYNNKCLSQKIEHIKELQKENEELKEKMGSAGYRIAELKMQIENYKLSENESLEIIADLKAKIEKLKNFIYSEIDFCMYCPLTNECENEEGTCPYAYATEEEQKKLLAEWITKNGS